MGMDTRGWEDSLVFAMSQIIKRACTHGYRCHCPPFLAACEVGYTYPYCGHQRGPSCIPQKSVPLHPFHLACEFLVSTRKRGPIDIR